MATEFMTVHLLIELLRALPQEKPVFIEYDGMAESFKVLREYENGVMLFHDAKYVGSDLTDQIRETIGYVNAD